MAFGVVRRLEGWAARGGSVGRRGEVAGLGSGRLAGARCAGHERGGAARRGAEKDLARAADHAAGRVKAAASRAAVALTGASAAFRADAALIQVGGQ